MPVWTVREAAACGLTEAERAAIVGRSRRFGLSGRAGISSKCESIREDTLERTRVRLESSRASTRKSYAVPDIPLLGSCH